MTNVAHLGFIVAAYAAAALVLGITTAVLVIEHAAQKRQLALLGDMGRDRP